MSKIWYSLINIQNLLSNEFQRTGTEVQEPGMERFNQPGWINRVWTSDLYRRAHIDVVDARETKGLWMMHCCVFPHLNNPAPIFGFDVIAGKNKITGCFIDFSPAGDPDHPMIDYFGEEASRYDWFKKRELPNWAKLIFSNHMIAAGNVSSDDELGQIETLVTILINHYLSTIHESSGQAENTADAQNFYARNQKQNPHTPKVMTSLGLNEKDVETFIQDCLFPEIR